MLPDADGKQLSISMVNLGRKWMMMNINNNNNIIFGYTGRTIRYWVKKSTCTAAYQSRRSELGWSACLPLPLVTIWRLP